MNGKITDIQRRKCITIKVRGLDANKLGWWARLRAFVFSSLGYGIIYAFPELTNENLAEFESQFVVVPPEDGEFVPWESSKESFNVREVVLDYTNSTLTIVTDEVDDIPEIV